jgi:hypothetical protein
MTSARMHLIVTCMLVVRRGGLECLQDSDRLLTDCGFEQWPVVESPGMHTRKFVCEYDSGSAGVLLDALCKELESAISLCTHDWAVFIHVVAGRETAWASLRMGKAPLRGTLDSPRARREIRTQLELGLVTQSIDPRENSSGASSSAWRVRRLRLRRD